MMFDDFVQNSRQQTRSGAADVNGRFGNGFEPDSDGYERREAARPSSSYGALPPITSLETGFVSGEDARLVSSDQSQPIFQLGRVQYAFPAPLALLTVSANVLTMCLYTYHSPVRLAQGVANQAAPPKLVRIDLDDPEKTVEAEVPLAPLPRSRNMPAPDPSLLGPHKMFSDPSGRHLIVTTRNGDNFYWISGWKKARPLPRLKGLVIDSIAWNPSVSGGTSSDASMQSKQTHRRIGSGASTPIAITTKEILIATQSGDIYETLISTTNASDDGEGDFLDRLARRTAGSVVGGTGTEIDKYLQHVFRLSERQSITGLAVQTFKGSRAAVIVTTSTRIYEFVGELGKGRYEDGSSGDSEILYGKLFAAYRKDSMPSLKSELPGDLPYSELHTWTPKGKKNATALAWLTGPGIYHSVLSYRDQQPGDSVIDSANLLPYPAIAFDEDGNVDQEVVTEIPLSIALTEFHFLLLYRDRIMGISTLDDQVIFQEQLPLHAHEQVIGIVVDSARNSYWLYTDSSIFEVVISHEDRNVWQIYLDRQQFEQALKYARSSSNRELILSAQGDHFFRSAKFIQAAQCYAQTFSRSFEEIVLRFIDCNERDALRYYLVMRLERLRKENLTQRMMLATWLVEIYLAKINDLEDIAAAEEASQNVDNYRIEMDLLHDELKQFLLTYRDNLDRKTVFGLIFRHGRTDLMLYYAAAMGEYDHIVRHWIAEEKWEAAVATMSGQTDLELYYRYAATLLVNAPATTVDSWIKRDDISPRRLIPAMILYTPQPDQSNEVIRYLHFVTRKGNTDQKLHNYLLLLLTEQAVDDGGLLAFITSSLVDPLTGLPYYDLEYALRICSRRGKTEACVRIYAKMNDFESAVDLAIKAGNEDLACTCAEAAQFYTSVESNVRDKSDFQALVGTDDRQALRKRLWLKIARFVVEEKNDLKSAMTFLARAPVLQIEDILPFFPEFTVIDSFKDDICKALETYAGQIDALKFDMDHATESAEAIRQDTEQLANRFVSVEADEKCSICQEPVMQRQFYVFPCSHVFHADCLVAETTKHLSPRTLRRILVLQDQISRCTNRQTPALPPSYAVAVAAVSGATRAAADTVTSGVSLLGLDKLRELVLPDAIVGAISASVSVGVASGRKALAPLDPFADPTASLRAKPTALETMEGRMEKEEEVDGEGVNGRLREDEEHLAELREELDSLVANACLLCDGFVQAINRPFIADPKDLDDWEL